MQKKKMSFPKQLFLKSTKIIVNATERTWNRCEKRELLNFLLMPLLSRLCPRTVAVLFGHTTNKKGSPVKAARQCYHSF